MKVALNILVLERSAAREIKCNGCGRPVLVFAGAPPQLCHEPPECGWFRVLMEKNDVQTAIGEVVDNVSN